MMSSVLYGDDNEPLHVTVSDMAHHSHYSDTEHQCCILYVSVFLIQGDAFDYA